MCWRKADIYIYIYMYIYIYGVKKKAQQPLPIWLKPERIPACGWLVTVWTDTAWKTKHHPAHSTLHRQHQLHATIGVHYLRVIIDPSVSFLIPRDCYYALGFCLGPHLSRVRLGSSHFSVNHFLALAPFLYPYGSLKTPKHPLPCMPPVWVVGFWPSPEISMFRMQNGTPCRR